MAKLDLIKSGKFKELSAQVFNQTLSGESTYTAVLDEREELALVEAVCDGSAAAKKIALKYWQHYAPFNSAEKLMIEHIKCSVMPEILLQLIKKWGAVPEQTKLICQAACGSGGEQYLPLVEACVKNCRTLSVNPELGYWFEKVDGQYGGEIALIYRSRFKKDDEEK